MVLLLILTGISYNEKMKLRKSKNPEVDLFYSKHLNGLYILQFYQWLVLAKLGKE